MQYNINIETLIINKGVLNIGNSMFMCCKELTTVFACDIEEIGIWSFNYCPNLEVFDLPNSVIRIEDLSFSGCHRLESIFLPQGMEYIGTEAFMDCQAICEMLIPISVDYIGANAFEGQINLITIKCEVSSKPENWNEAWSENYFGTIVWGYIGN